MRADEAVVILDALEAVGVPVWVGGGWGVDALAGTVTREHRDLDLVVQAEHLDTALGALGELGFAVETDWLPVRVEVGGGPGGWVDLHPVVLDEHGDGVQSGFDGETFLYPAEDLTLGKIGDRVVGCISARLQRLFHSGYVPRPQDLHDLAVLEGMDE